MPPISSVLSNARTGTSLLFTDTRIAALSRVSVGVMENSMVSVRAFFGSVFRSFQLRMILLS